MIADDGKTARTRFLDNDSYIRELYNKFGEEIQEFRKNPTAEEAADIYEVFVSLLDAYKVDPGDVYVKSEEKAVTHGRFSDRVFLEYVEEDSKKTNG